MVSIRAKLNYSIPSALSKTVYYDTSEILKSLKKAKFDSNLIFNAVQGKDWLAAVFNLQIIRCSKTAMFKA